MNIGQLKGESFTFFGGLNEVRSYVDLLNR